MHINYRFKDIQNSEKDYSQKSFLEFLLWLSGLLTQVVSMSIWVRSPALLNGSKKKKKLPFLGRWNEEMGLEKRTHFFFFLRLSCFIQGIKYVTRERLVDSCSKVLPGGQLSASRVNLIFLCLVFKECIIDPAIPLLGIQH